jgi:protease II
MTFKFETPLTASEHYAYGRPESAHYAEYLAARPPCTNVCCQPHATNNHMPLLAYEVAEMEQPINWVIEIATVLLAAVAAGFVVFVLGW